MKKNYECQLGVKKYRYMWKITLVRFQKILVTKKGKKKYIQSRNNKQNCETAKHGHVTQYTHESPMFFKTSTLPKTWPHHKQAGTHRQIPLPPHPLKKLQQFKKYSTLHQYISYYYTLAPYITLTIHSYTPKHTTSPITISLVFVTERKKERVLFLFRSFYK